MDRMKLITLLIITSCLLVGCFQSREEPLKTESPTSTGQSGTEDQALESGNDSSVELNQDEMSANQPTEPAPTDEPVIKKYYPKQTSTQTKSSGSEEQAERQFTLTNELAAKLYLADKYDPGICYGMPGPVPQQSIDSVLSHDPGLTLYLRTNYDLPTDLDVYTKIKQLNGIRLDEIAGGKYSFNFTDGQCCTLTAYQGEISIIGQNITDNILQQETKNNPC